MNDSNRLNFVASIASIVLVLVCVAPAPAMAQSADDTVPVARIEPFVAMLVRDMNRFWHGEFSRQGFHGWRDAKFVFFDRKLQTPCGPRLAKMGLFYCTVDHTIYLPRTSLMELRDESGVAGDFAQALAVAHEMGHHAQLGLRLTQDAARQHRHSTSKARRRSLKIAHELQADCFAGLWARSVEARGLLEDGDLEEAIAAARSMGDDSLKVPRQRWKHGSARERARSFTTGFRTGTFARCRAQ